MMRRLLAAQYSPLRNNLYYSYPNRSFITNTTLSDVVNYAKSQDTVIPSSHADILLNFRK